MIEEIINSISSTRTAVKNLTLPDQQGIYAFYLRNCGDLGKFGTDGQVIYAGLAEHSLNSRDTTSHLGTGQTGWSSLRRSIGAILKNQLQLRAVKRDINPKKLRADKYKFDGDGEQKLTDWMSLNLDLGYWISEQQLDRERLRKLEEQILIQLHPTLDLDARTKKYNPLAKEIDELRGICRNEVKLMNK